MIAALFLLPVPFPQFATLQVRGPETMEWVGEVPGTGGRFLLPLSTLSERVVRAVPGPRGVELFVAASGTAELASPLLKVRAVHHSRASRVVLSGEQLRLLENMSLPGAIEGAAEAPAYLPRLARQDQAGVRNAELQVSAGPAGTDLILIPMQSEALTWQLEARQPGGQWGLLTGNNAAGHALRLDGGVPWQLRIGDVGLDQVLHARSTGLKSPGEVLFSNALTHIEKTQPKSFRRHGRGPLRRHWIPQGVGNDLTQVEENARILRPGELLRERYPIPETAKENWTTTLVVDVYFSGAKTISSAPSVEAPAQAPFFSDLATKAGVFDVHFEGPAQQLDIRPTMGPGAAWGDVDGDGWQDLYLVQGSGREGSTPPHNRILRNLGDGHFEPLPGAADTGAGMGALFFDFDGDGDQDLYVANYGPDVLYRNDGQAGFTDVSAEHQLAGDGWSAGLCAADTDGDGDLDLYVTSYLVYDTALMPPVESLPGYAREDPTEMLPFAFPGARNHFLENVEGKLVDRTETMGLADEQGRGMQPVFWDFDLDGDQDLYIANDVSFNLLLRNEGNGSFKDISFQVGMDDPRGGMGVATGDVDGDGDPDLFLTNWELEANALYRNNHISTGRRKSHTGTFQDITVYSKLGRGSVGTTSWGAVFFDADNDGDLDLFVPNGYTSPDYESTGICVGQPNQFFLNDGRGRFEDASARAGLAVLAPLASRSAALCDYDRDGRLDLFVTNNNGPYQLLHNEIESTGHWIGVQLQSAKGQAGNVGARLTLEVDGQLLTRELQAGSGYLSGHAAEIHFGLGEANSVGELQIHWPSGTISKHQLESLDRWITLLEPRCQDQSRTNSFRDQSSRIAAETSSEVSAAIRDD